MSTFHYHHRRHKLLLCMPPSYVWTSWLPQTRRNPAFFSTETLFQKDQSPRLKSHYLQASLDLSAVMYQAHYESVPLPLFELQFLHKMQSKIKLNQSESLLLVDKDLSHIFLLTLAMSWIVTDVLKKCHTALCLKRPSCP